MPLPKLTSGLSPAGTDLGLGDMLGQQVADETEEMRKKRLAQMQMGQNNSPATMMLFGNSGGMGSANGA